MTIGSVPVKFLITVDPDQSLPFGRCAANCPYDLFRIENTRMHLN